MSRSWLDTYAFGEEGTDRQPTVEVPETPANNVTQLPQQSDSAASEPSTPERVGPNFLSTYEYGPSSRRSPSETPTPTPQQGPTQAAFAGKPTWWDQEDEDESVQYLTTLGEQ